MMERCDPKDKACDRQNRWWRYPVWGVVSLWEFLKQPFTYVMIAVIAIMTARGLMGLGSELWETALKIFQYLQDLVRGPLTWEQALVGAGLAWGIVKAIYRSSIAWKTLRKWGRQVHAWWHGRTEIA